MITIVKTIASKVQDAYRHIKVQVMGKNDVQTPVEASPYGMDSNPVKDLAAIYAPSTVSGEPVIIGYLLKDRLAEVGELRLYATNASGALQNYIWLKADGTIEVGGEDDNLVRYSELETAFNDLKGTVNDLLGKWNNFCLDYVPGSPAMTGLPATLAASTIPDNTADISGAKIEEIKTS